MIERETEGQLARLRDKSARSIPEWVGTLTEESSAWQLLYPGKVPKNTTVNTDSDDDDNDDADNDDGKKKELKAGTTGLTSWPKFIQVVCLSRRRPPSSVSTLLSTEQLGTYHATYRQAARDGPVELEKVILTPMVVHRNLGIHYQRRMVEGWTHDEAMKEIHKYCGLPVVWRGCLPFTGTFDPTRLRNAWIVNWIIWCFLLGWLAWSFLSLRDELPWDGIFGTLILGIVVEPGSKIAKAIAIGLVVYLVLEVNVKSRALYQRRKVRNSPDAYAERTASSVTVEDADADDNDDADGYGDDEAGDSPRKQSQYTPPQALKALARPLVAISPAKTYEAMQIGAALRRLDERKHQETTAIAKKLVPKLNAEQRRHEEEISQLDLCRATCIDNATVETIDAQKTGMEHAHCAALGLLEADVCPPTLHLRIPKLASPPERIDYCSFVATSTRLQATLALANVERAHQQAIATIRESAARSLVMQPPSQEPPRAEAADMASLTAHQQAALKIVAQHTIQKVDRVTANHELVMRLLKDQLVGLGHSSMDDMVARRAIENELEKSERAHNELLKSLEEKVQQSPVCTCNIDSVCI